MAGTALCGAHFAGEARLSTLRAVIVLGGGQRMVHPTPPPLWTTPRSAFLAQRDTGELALGRCFTGISTAIYLRALTWLRAGGRAEGSLVLDDPR